MCYHGVVGGGLQHYRWSLGFDICHFHYCCFIHGEQYIIQGICKTTPMNNNAAFASMPPNWEREFLRLTDALDNAQISSASIRIVICCPLKRLDNIPHGTCIGGWWRIYLPRFSCVSDIESSVNSSGNKSTYVENGNHHFYGGNSRVSVQLPQVPSWSIVRKVAWNGLPQTKRISLNASINYASIFNP